MGCKRRKKGATFYTLRLFYIAFAIFEQSGITLDIIKIIVKTIGWRACIRGVGGATRVLGEPLTQLLSNRLRLSTRTRVQVLAVKASQVAV
ncbi:hypothetical protein CEQ07_10645 [Oligella urethralis]|nr:hypothetical protein CEQ07_10645 [Oligella urethralis]